MPNWRLYSIWRNLFVRVTKSRLRYVLGSILWLHTPPSTHNARFGTFNDSRFNILTDDITMGHADTCLAWLSLLMTNNQPPHVCNKGNARYQITGSHKRGHLHLSRSLSWLLQHTTSAPPPHWWRRLKQTSNILDRLTGLHSPWRALTTPFILTLTCSDTMGFGP